MAKTDLADKFRSQMRRGLLEYYLLLLLDSRQAYSADIIDLLKEADLLIVEGSLYPLLSKMRRAGIIGYTWAESTQGPPRKYYTLTDKGRSILDKLNQNWAEMNAQVDLIRAAKHENNGPQITPAPMQEPVDETRPTDKE